MLDGQPEPVGAGVAVRLRAASDTPEDVERIAAMLRESFRFHATLDPAYYRPPDAPSCALAREYVARELRAGTTRFLLCEDTRAGASPAVLGFISFFVDRDCYVDTLYSPCGVVLELLVVDAMRSSGLRLGERLLREAVAQMLAEPGVTAVRLECSRFNAGGLRFYERVGFRTRQCGMYLPAAGALALLGEQQPPAPRL